MPTWQCRGISKCGNANWPGEPSACCICSTGNKKKHHQGKFLSNTTIIDIIRRFVRPSPARPWCLHVSVRSGKASCRHCCKRVQSVWCVRYSLEFTHCPAWEAPSGASSLYSSVKTVYTPDVMRTDKVTHAPHPRARHCRYWQYARVTVRQ